MLTRLAKDGDPVVKQLQPAATELAPTFAALHEVSPEFKGLFTKLDDVVDASEKGLPAFNAILGRLPSLLDAFQPFLRNANPMVQYIGNNNREISSFFGNVVSATSARDSIDALDQRQRVGPLPAHVAAALARGAGLPAQAGRLLAPERLPAAGRVRPAAERPAGPDHRPVLEPRRRAADELAAGRAAAVHRPARLPHAPAATCCGRACRAQGTFPGFSTIFPQLRAQQP